MTEKPANLNMDKLISEIQKKDPSGLTDHEQLILELYSQLQKEKVSHLHKNANSTNTTICTRHSNQCVVVGTIPEIVVEVNSNKVYIWANQQAIDFFGEDVIGKEASHYFLDSQETYKKVEALFNGSDELFYTESWQRRKDGEKRLLSWWSRSVKNKTGEVIGAISSARDITEQHEIENMIRESQEILMNVINTIPSRVFWKDKNLNYLGCNEKFAKDAGYSKPEELIGKDDYQMGWKDQADLYRADDLMVIQSGKPKLLIEEPQTTPTGETIHLLTSKVPLKNAEGEVYAVLGTYMDITPRRKAEQELMEAKRKAEESDKLKTSFLANLSHEVRTPMNAILGFSSFLKDPDLSENERNEFMKIIEDSSEQLLDLIEDTISISKLEIGQTGCSFSEFDLNDLLYNLHLNYRRKAQDKGLEYIAKLPDLSISNRIKTDKEKLENVIRNLLKNAIKFTEQGSITTWVENDRDNLKFYVKDTGIGIEPSKYDIIFERFRQSEDSFKRSFGGSGLGLSISKSYIEMLGGEINVSSTPGEGSTFSFSVPLK